MAQAYPVRLRSVHSVEDVLVSMTAIEALQTSPSTLMLSMSPRFPMELCGQCVATTNINSV